LLGRGSVSGHGNDDDVKKQADEQEAAEYDEVDPPIYADRREPPSPGWMGMTAAKNDRLPLGMGSEQGKRRRDL